jgi:hypothetical protein
MAHSLFFSKTPFEDFPALTQSHHTHQNLTCGICNQMVHPTAICITKLSPDQCSIPQAVRCAECWGILDEPATLGADQSRP